MLLSLSTACLHHLPLRATFGLAAGAGCDALELVMSPQAWLRGPRYVSSLAEAHGVRIGAVHQALLNYGPWGKGPGRMIDATQMALAIQAPYAVVHGTWAQAWGTPEAQRWLQALTECREYVRGSGTRLALENHGHYGPSDGQSVLGALSAFHTFCQQHDLDVTLDTCHAGTYAMGLDAAYTMIRGRLGNVHLSDLRRGDPRGLGRHLSNLLDHHRMPGEGDLPLEQFLVRLQDDGYAGAVTLEISPWALGAWSLCRARRRLAQAVGYVRAATQTLAQRAALAYS